MRECCKGLPEIGSPKIWLTLTGQGLDPNHGSFIQNEYSCVKEAGDYLILFPILNRKQNIFLQSILFQNLNAYSNKFGIYYFRCYIIVAKTMTTNTLCLTFASDVR